MAEFIHYSDIPISQRSALHPSTWESESIEESCVNSRRCHSERKYPVVKGHKCPELQGYKRRVSTPQDRDSSPAPLHHGVPAPLHYGVPAPQVFFDGLRVSPTVCPTANAPSTQTTPLGALSPSVEVLLHRRYGPLALTSLVEDAPVAQREHQQRRVRNAMTLNGATWAAQLSRAFRSRGLSAIPG